MKTHHIIVIAATICASFGCSRHEEERPAAAAAGHGSVRPVGRRSAHRRERETRTALDNQRNVVWKSGRPDSRCSAPGNPSERPMSPLPDNTRTGIFNPVESSKTVTDAQRYAVYPAGSPDEKGSRATRSKSTCRRWPDNPTHRPSAQGPTSRRCRWWPRPMTIRSNSRTSAAACCCASTTIRRWASRSRASKRRPAAGSRSPERSRWKPRREPATESGDDGNLGHGGLRSGANISSNGDLSKPDGFLIFLPAGTYAQGFSFRITDTDGCRYEIRDGTGRDGDGGVVTPLQKPAADARYYGTANCYRADASAQTLSIDATPYYTFSRNYVHEGIRCTDASGAPAGVPAKAQIVWQQPENGASGSVIDAPAMEGATLKVPVTGTKGNAVVAVCKADGTILWSYHIWVSEAQDIACRFEEAGAYTMLDRNLGATSTTPKDRNAYGLFTSGAGPRSP